MLSLKISNISFVNSNGNPNIGLEVENIWNPTSHPDFEYLEINGKEAKPKMTYDPELKTRSLFWSKLFDNFHQTLSNKPVKTALEIAQELDIRVKNEL